MTSKKNMLVFDSSAIISLGITCSFGVLRKLKEAYGGNFMIPKTVKKEVVDHAIRSHRFMYEGYKIKRLISDNVLTVLDESPYSDAVRKLASLANSTFSARGKGIKIIHPGEISLLVMAHRESKDDAVVIDERTTRLLVESPKEIPSLLGGKLHTRIKTDKSKLKQLRKEMTSISILRSADLCLAGYLKGYLDSNKKMFEGLLWALKFAGCAISGKEIAQYLRAAK